MTAQKLADDNPDVTAFRATLAYIRDALAFLLFNAHKRSEANDEQRQVLALRQKLADDNPENPQFQRDLATALAGIAFGFFNSGKTDEAIRYYSRELTIREKLANAGQGDLNDSERLSNCLVNTANLLRRSGRLDEALAACQRADAVSEPLVKAHPEVTLYRAIRGETYLRLGQVRCDMKNLSGAAAAWRHARQLLDEINLVQGEQRFMVACCHASLAGVAGLPGSGVSASDGSDQTEKAMAALRQAVTRGYRMPHAYLTESALDPLRTRPDFKLLMMDTTFPAKAFAR